MTTKLNKPVKRMSNELIRDRSKLRGLVITLYPAGHIGLRLAGCRSEETIPLAAVYERAIKMRLAQQAREKDERRAAKQGKSYAEYVRVKRKRG